MIYMEIGRRRVARLRLTQIFKGVHEAVTEHRKVQVLLPEELVREIDYVADKEKVNRSGLIREATRQYLTQRRSDDLRRQLIDGYRAMANLNLELSKD